MIETIVVIAVLGLALSVVAGFAPRRHGGLDLTSAADSLAGALRSARAEAIGRAVPVLFVPAVDGRSYAVGGVVKGLPQGIVLTAAPTIRFTPDGSSSGGTLRLWNGVSARELGVDWLTGRVSVTDKR